MSQVPEARGGDGPPPAEGPGGPQAPRAGLRVLIVDDVEDNREMYAAYLRFAGFVVDVAADGAAALTKVWRQAPDVVVLDLTMPGLDGWETCRRLKGSASTRDVIVVALSAHALGDAAERARSAGCDAYLAKPCLPEELLAEITRLLAPPPPSAPTPEAPRPRSTPGPHSPAA